MWNSCMLLAILLYGVKPGLQLRKSKRIHTFFISWSRILTNVSEKDFLKPTMVPILQTHTKIQFHSIPKAYYIPDHFSYLTCLFSSSYTERHLKFTCVNYMPPVFQFPNINSTQDQSRLLLPFWLGQKHRKGKFPNLPGQLLTQQLICAVRPFSQTSVVVSKYLITFKMKLIVLSLVHTREIILMVLEYIQIRLHTFVSLGASMLGLKHSLQDWLA